VVAAPHIHSFAPRRVCDPFQHPRARPTTTPLAAAATMADTVGVVPTIGVSTKYETMPMPRQVLINPLSASTAPDGSDSAPRGRMGRGLIAPQPRGKPANAYVLCCRPANTTFRSRLEYHGRR